MRRDLDLDFDPAELVLAPPDRSQLKEIFRRFEFRGLLSRLDTLDEALPGGARSRSRASRCRGARASSAASGRVGFAAADDRAAVATDDEVSSSARARRGLEGELVVHDAKSLGVDAADDTLLAAYLIEPGRSDVRALRPRRRVRRSSSCPSPPTDEETAALVVAAELPRRLAPLMLARLEERSLTALYREIELPLTRVLADMERAGREDRHLPDGRDHGAARRARRRARGDRLRARGRGVHARLDPAGRARPVRAARPDRRAARARPGYSTDAKVLRSIRARARDRAGDRGVARALEAAQHLPRPAADADRRVDRAPAHDDQPDRRLDRPALDDEPEPAVDPDPHRPRARDPLGVHRRGRREAALGRLLADRAAHPRAPLRRAEAAGGVRARRGHPPRDRGRGARQGPGDADDRRALDREDDQLRDRLRDLGLRPLREPRDPARAGAGATSTPTSRASRTSRTSSRGRSSRRRATAT